MSKAMKSAKRSKSAAEADTDKEEGKEEARKSLKDKSKKEATKDAGKKTATARSAVRLLKGLKVYSLRPVKMTVRNLRLRAGEGEVCPRGPAGRLPASTRITT